MPKEEQIYGDYSGNHREDENYSGEVFIHRLLVKT
jgi:hypothetical protein